MTSESKVALVTGASRGIGAAVLSIVVPLTLVLEAVGSLADAEAAAFVVLPLAHVGFGHAGVQLLVLKGSKW